MRTPILASVAVAGALFTATVAPASAATPGVGTTSGTLNVLGIDAGNLLSLDLLTDQGTSNTNTTAGARSALAQLLALSLASPAAGLSQSVPLLKAETTNGEQTKSQAVTPVDNPVLSGTLLPVDLSALVDSTGALSGITAGVSDLSVLGGLVELTATDLGFEGDAVAADASGTRDVDVDALTVLDLEALLGGLGIPLTDLPLDAILGMLGGLDQLDDLTAVLEPLGLDILDGIDLEALAAGDTAALSGLVDDLFADVDELEALIFDSVCDSGVTDALGDVLDLLGGVLPVDPCDDIPALIDQAEDALEELLDQLLALLDGVLDTILDTALLSVTGLDVSVITEATNAVNTSSSDITAVLGGVQIGDLALPGVDLTDAIDQINALVTQVEGALGTVLAAIDPSLANLIDISALQKVTSVTENAGTVTADASFLGLGVDILPDVAALTNLLGALGGTDSLGGLFESAGAGVPLPTTGIFDINDALNAGGVDTDGFTTPGGEVVALSEGASVQVASISQRSTFATASGSTGNPTTPTTLPKTGSSDTMLLLFGGLAVLGALALRRWLHRPVG